MNSERSKIKRIAGFTFLALVLVVIALAVADALKNARVSILLTPYKGAIATIDGKPYNSGYYRFYPKKNVQVEISAPGFKTKTVTVDFEANKTIAIREYLEHNEDGLHYYIKNDADIDDFKLVIDKEDEEAQKVIETYLKKQNLLDELPIEIASESDPNAPAGSSAAFNAIYITEGYNDKNSHCMQKTCLSIYGKKDEDKVAKTLKELGYDYKDFEIYYRVDDDEK